MGKGQGVKDEREETWLLMSTPCFVLLLDGGTRLTGFERPMYTLLRISVHPSASEGMTERHDVSPCRIQTLSRCSRRPLVWREQGKRLLYRLLL